MTITIPEHIIREAAAVHYAGEGTDTAFEDLSSSFRASLITAMESAAQPVALWARLQALRGAYAAVADAIGERHDSFCTENARESVLGAIEELMLGTAKLVVRAWLRDHGKSIDPATLVAVRTEQNILITVGGEIANGAFVVGDGVVIQHKLIEDD